MCSGLHVPLGLREPWKLCDADEGCHRRGAARRGAQRLGRNEAAADCTGKQTKRGAVGVRRRWGWDGGEMELQPLWDACSLVWEKKEKSSALLIPNQHNVSRGDGKRSPSVALLGPRLMCRHLRGFQWSPTLGRVSWADRGMEGQGERGGGDGCVMLDLQTTVFATSWCSVQQQPILIQLSCSSYCMF